MTTWYTDATFDPRTKTSYIGYCSKDLFASNWKRVSATDINDAEIKALKFLELNVDLSDGEVYTDSESAVRFAKDLNYKCSHVPRGKNPAGYYIQMIKSQKERR